MTDPPEPTVFIVDDDDAVRQFVCNLLASVNLRAEAFPSAQAFLDAYDPNRPGCLLLDIRMPGMSGLELQQELRSQGVDVPTIIITGHADVQVAVRAMQMGAIDFVEKPFNNELLLARVQKAVAASLRSHDERSARKRIEARLASLTPRERQVLDLVGAGEKNKVIAKQLNISEKTVELHRAKVMEKMQASSLAELIKMVVGVPDPHGASGPAKS